MADPGVIDTDMADPAGPFLYFSYGSNLDVERLHQGVPSARLVSIARLEGHRLGFSMESRRTWHGGVGDLVAAPGDEVWGALWVVEASDSRALDEEQGAFRDPPAYGRITVEVTTLAGDVVRCRSYRVANPDPTGFLPSPAYKATLLRGARALGLPSDYLARLEALEDNGAEDGAGRSAGTAGR